MKPVEPTPVTYVLELTQDQLVDLGLLSYRFEQRGIGRSLFAQLPENICTKVRQKANHMPYTATTVDWSEDA